MEDSYQFSSQHDIKKKNLELRVKRSLGPIFCTYMRTVPLTYVSPIVKFSPRHTPQNLINSQDISFKLNKFPVKPTF